MTGDSARRRRRGGAAGAVMLAATLLLGGCMSDPPPPAVQETEEIAPPPAEYPNTRTIHVATNSGGSGFNPHLGADQGSVTSAIATMTLPSAFQPVQRPDGIVWEMTGGLLTDARITSQEPFRITYTIDPNAQWSDGVPVTGEDFSYLWQQMIRRPDAVGAAAYRLIEKVQTRAGGKVVDVTFNRPYPRWRELFSFLLPSHSLRGSADGFLNGMDGGKPLSAGPFTVYSIDRTRDEIRLIRNDRYWKAPTELDQIVLRRAGNLSQTVESIRTGNSALSLVSVGPAAAAEIAAVPQVRTGRLPTTRVLGLTVNARSTATEDLNVRRALLGLLDASLITYAAAGDDLVEGFANTVFAPSDADYYPVDRPRPDAEEVTAWLTSAGYRAETGTARDQPGAPPAPVPAWRKDGRDLVIRVGVVSDDQRLVSAAGNIVDQLRSAGITARVLRLTDGELYGEALPDGAVDLVVGWDGAGVDPANALATRVGCPATAAGTSSESPAESSTAADETDSGDTSNGADGAVDSTEAPRAEDMAENPSGLCDPALQGLSDRALAADDPAELLREAEPLLAGAAIYLPVYQTTVQVAVTDTVTGVPLTGSVQQQIFADAADWELK